jgi:hypothetical protein
MRASGESLRAIASGDLTTFWTSATIGTTRHLDPSSGGMHLAQTAELWCALVNAVHHQPELEAHENNEDHDRRDERR